MSNVKAKHIIAAMKKAGHVKVALLAESLADREEADELDKLAAQLPVTGGEVRQTAIALRRRAKARLR